MTPIVDAHHHIWRQADLPWLVGPIQPRIFGSYEAIRRDYPIAEYRTEAETQGVVRSIYVQTNWAHGQGQAEAEWVESVARATGWPHAIIAHADITVADARPAFEALAKVPLVRGLRMQLHWHENPQYRFAPRANLSRDPNVRRNIRGLAEFGFTFDLQVFAPQMVDAATLAGECPDTTFVLQHAGMLEDLSPLGRAEWRFGMERLAACPNVTTKLSGLGTFVHRSDPELITQIVRETVEIFGAERCLFGSNFPIEKLWTDYAALVAAYRAALAPLPPADQHAILHDNAIRIYGMKV